MKVVKTGKTGFTQLATKTIRKPKPCVVCGKIINPKEEVYALQNYVVYTGRTYWEDCGLAHKKCGTKKLLRYLENPLKLQSKGMNAK